MSDLFGRTSATTKPTLGLCGAQYSAWRLDLAKRLERMATAKWNGPFQVLLTAETTVKTVGHR